MQKFCILERLGCKNSSWPFFRRISQLTLQPPRGTQYDGPRGGASPYSHLLGKPPTPPPPELKQILSANRYRSCTMLDVCERLDPVLCPYCPYLLATQWGCAGDRVKMVVKVHYGTVLKARICRHVKYTSHKTVPQCTLTTSRPGIPCNLKVANIRQLFVSHQTLSSNTALATTWFVASLRPADVFPVVASKKPDALAG